MDRKPIAHEFAGEALRSLREDLGLTQSQVADGLKALNRRLFGRCGPGTVSGWERGAKPGADVVPNLATVLGCVESRLYRRTK